MKKLLPIFLVLLFTVGIAIWSFAGPPSPPLSLTAVLALFSGSGDYLKADGTTGTPAGSGDMEKATYDTGDDGACDTANAAAAQAITDNAIVTVDQADAADDEYARFTANGVESRSAAETLADLSLEEDDIEAQIFDSDAETIAGIWTLNRQKYTVHTAEPTDEAVGDILVADCDTWDPASRGGTNDYMVICTATGSPGTWLAVRDMVTGELLVSSLDLGDGVVEITNNANPTTDAAGEVAVDTDDDFIEFYSDASMVVSAIQTRTLTISEPDQQADDIVLFHFDTRAFPHGVTMLGYTITASAAVSDTHVLEEWDDRAGTTQATSESIALSTAQRAEDDGTLSDSAFAADSYLVLNLDDSTDDTDYLEITFMYRINPGD